MNVIGVGARSQLAAQNLVEMRRHLEDLQRQLGTGQKSTTYAGLGPERGLAVSLRAQLARLDGYDATITTVGMRLDLAQSLLARMSEIGRAARASALHAVPIKATGQTVAQEAARAQLDELIDLLDTQADGRFLFAGRRVDQPGVETTARILDGDGARAGLKQIIAERRLADLGASGLGRLVSAAAAGTVSLAEDATGSPFGFKLLSATTDIAGASVSGPTGSPPVIDVALTANPSPGNSVTFTLQLPDGTTETVRLTATASPTPAAGEFTIGANATATAANLQSALDVSLGSLARTSLVAASALAAADDFFNIDASNPPQRVAGPPFDTVTALVAGTTADTVFWYTGEMAADPPRSSAIARVDDAITASYGLRANEEAIRFLVQNVAAFAATTFTPNDPDGSAAYAAMTQRLQPALSGPAGLQKIDDIASDLAGVQATVNAAADRHRQTHNALEDLLQQIEGVPTEQVASEILALQTRLQASLQTTATLYQISLVNYL